MAGIVARVTASFDRIPAVHAFIFMLVSGALTGFAVFGMSPTPALEILPLGLLLLFLTLALVLMGFSKPVVVRRDNGSLLTRFKQGLRHFATMLAFQTAIFAVVIIPAYFLKFSTIPTSDQRLNQLDTPLAPISTQQATRINTNALASTSKSTATPLSSSRDPAMIPSRIPTSVVATPVVSSSVKRATPAPKPPPEPRPTVTASNEGSSGAPLIPLAQ